MPQPLSAARIPMVRPTFANLMADNERTPKRKPVMDHDGVTKNVVEYLGNKPEWRIAETEMVLPPMPKDDDFGRTSRGVERRADVMAWNPRDREFYIFECKANWGDFFRDHKFIDYKKWCNLFAFAVPEELAVAVRLRMEDVGGYKGVGLLVIPNDSGRRRMVRKPVRRKWDKGEYQKVVERWAMSCQNRLIGTRLEIARLEYQWKMRNLERRPLPPLSERMKYDPTTPARSS